MSVPRLLIVQTGTAGPLVEAHGDYPAWFMRALGEELPVLRAHEGEKLSRDTLFRTGVQGILVTGSPASVTEHHAWAEDLGGELLRAGERGVPVLGVCFGHQLLARAAGGDVVKNPRGREIGTVRVQLTPEARQDPLFAWATEGTLEVQATHVDAVYPVPERATLLASNENTPAQAMRLSETVASVQFHPEMTPREMSALIASRAERLRAEGLDPEALQGAVRSSDAGVQILRAFAEQARLA